MSKIDIDKSLFEEEAAALHAAMANIADQRFAQNELLPSYKSLASYYGKLLKITRKVFYISDSQGQELQRHQNEIQNLLDNANQGFLTFGRDLKVDRQYSAECIRIFGRKIAGLSISKLLESENDIAAKRLSETFERVFTCSNGLEQEELKQLPSIFQINDRDICVECKIISQADEPSEGNLVMMILTDITERLRAEEKIYFLSYHDKLTALHNRAYVEGLLPDLEQPDYLPMSIIMIDMNGLKLVNDVFGHQQGDLLLIALAKVLEKCGGPQDIIARWGGDEFLVLLPKTDKAAGRKVCARIENACNEVVDCVIPLSAAIGAATRDSEFTSLAETFNAAENRMYNDKMTKSGQVRQRIVANLEEMLHNRCFESHGHNKRVLQLATDFVAFLGFDINSAEMKPLQQLAVLHDIGKVAIPREILGKSGPLTANDWEIVKSHSEIGYRLAQSIGDSAVADIILTLHERWDGSGYPRNLVGKQIPLLARIFSLVDVYDIITHDRPYKAAIDKQAALSEIESVIGSHFDPELAMRFREFMIQD